MLVILVGPSGVGKTTIMNELSHRQHWKVVPTFHTRSKRAGELEKIFMDEEEFDKLVKLDFFYAVQHVFSYRYGQPRFYIDNAIADTEHYWVFDIHIKHVIDFIKTGARIFYILPDNAEQIAVQLQQSNREVNIETALSDYDNYYQSGMLDKNITIIKNQPNDLNQAIASILNQL